jgi:hypothetical protein
MMHGFVYLDVSSYIGLTKGKELCGFNLRACVMCDGTILLNNKKLQRFDRRQVGDF